MSLTPSTMLELRTKAPEFNLKSCRGESVSLADFAGARGYVIAFICNHCPFVIQLKEHLSQTARNYQEQGIQFIAISSNDIEGYPQDSPDNMRKDQDRYGYPFPYLYDETQSVAKAYKAACTPDFYLFDRQLKLVYRGRYDEARPGNTIEVSGKDLIAAMDALLNDRPIAIDQHPSMGCSIKWIQ